MKIEGLKELEKKLKKLSDVAQKDAKQEALYSGAVMVHGQADSLAPVAEIAGGTLKGSLTFEVDKDDATIFTPTEYAPYVEYGTSKMAAQPYLRPALDNNKSNIISLFSKIYAKHLKG